MDSAAWGLAGPGPAFFVRLSWGRGFGQKARWKNQNSRCSCTLDVSRMSNHFAAPDGSIRGCLVIRLASR